MLEEKEKKLVYFAISVIVLLLIIVLLIIWVPMFKSKDNNIEISSFKKYDDGYYINMMKESYKTVVSQCVNKDNFEETYLLLDNDYLEQINMNKEELKNYLISNDILTYSTSTAIIYCSNIRTDNEKYIYTYIYKVGDTERKVHIIENYYGKYSISFLQDSYPVVNSKEYDLLDSITGLEFKLKAIQCFDENIIFEISIINNTTEEFDFNFSSVEDSELIYNSDGTNKKASLSSVVVGSQTSEIRSIPGSNNKIKLSYGVNIENQNSINHILFNNVLRLNGEKTNIEIIIK